MGRRRGNGVPNVSSCLELASMGPGSVSTASVCSAYSYLDGADTEDIQIDEFERRLEALFEKRGSTREKALESLAVMLRVDYRDSDCLAHNEAITGRCLMALKRGSAMESSLASQLLGLHILTLGQPDDSLFEALKPELERTAIGANGGGAAVQCAAVDSLALAAFVLAEDEAGTRAVMDRLQALWRKGDAKVRASAVRGWSFLLTSLDRQLRDDEAAACLTGLAALMEERDLEQRSAAGEAVAVLRTGVSAGLLEVLAEEGVEAEEAGAQEQEDEQGGAEEAEEDGAACELKEVQPARNGAARNGGAAAGGNGGGRGGQGRGAGVANHGSGGRAARRAAAEAAEGGDAGGDMENVLGRMQDLAANKGDRLRRSRRERASQRSTFRGLLAALSGDEVPECRIKLQHGDSLTVEGVAATHQLAFLRRFLAGGFQAHLQRNPLLHDVFGFRPRTERPERMSAVEKRLSRSCHSAEAKARTANRQWSRDAKSSRLGMGY